MLQALSAKKNANSSSKSENASASSTTKPETQKVEFEGSIQESTSVLPRSDLRTYADSGATIHYFHSLSSFIPGSSKLCNPKKVVLANNEKLEATFCGNVRI